jgi:hypothetical protein
MTQTKAQDKAQSTRMVDAHDGAMGEEKMTAVEQFTIQLLGVYLPTRISGTEKSSDYAKHKPVRTMLKTYRMYRSLPSAERRFMMISEVREVFLNSPDGIRPPNEYDIEAKTIAVVDGFLNLVGFLYADISSLVARNENRLVHAIDLAMDLHYWDVRNLKDIEWAERLVQTIKNAEKDIGALQVQPVLTDEEQEQLSELGKERSEAEKNLKRTLTNLRTKAKRGADADRIEQMLKS